MHVTAIIHLEHNGVFYASIAKEDNKQKHCFSPGADTWYDLFGLQAGVNDCTYRAECVSAGRGQRHCFSPGADTWYDVGCITGTVETNVLNLIVCLIAEGGRIHPD